MNGPVGLNILLNAYLNHLTDEGLRSPDSYRERLHCKPHNHSSMPIAQINIALMLAPIDSPVMEDFVNNLDRINALAESSPGFVWRLKDDVTNDATSINVYDNDYIIVNMSVWESVDALFTFTYKSDHVEIFTRRKEWFKRMKDMHMVVWYIPDGYQPTALEGKERLEYMQKHGETPHAFTFRSKFSAEDAAQYQAL